MSPVVRNLAVLALAPLALGGAPAAEKCKAPAEKYWALDTPNNECTEVCLSTTVQRSEFWVFTVGKGLKAGNESHPCADNKFHTFKETHVIGAGPLKIAMDKYLADAFGGPPAAEKCEAPAEKYWALDTPNNECAEACLSTGVQRSEFWVLTGGKGLKAGNESHPCAENSFHTFKQTDIIGAGPLKIAMDKYLPDGKSVADPNPKGKCALACSAKAIGVYWACAAVCIKEEAPDSCITAGCLASVAAYDVDCLKGCNKTAADLIV